ncbi:nitrate- and nitrite sensing domain-containing protein [Catellatospora sp. KI3]|uniref:sensor histidine kinase n=1 Tax=Catellatospora sp. KI3 TaxID=3041620 RepID=UPI002482A872|nr:nitrate- and nitrite sensing domain-containing protein [Catellatospora sp. KI3]MDI1462167.1 nitrate- and nitrite sensing domain-containing protein [Catellatospora sp. KI3]
MTLAVVPLIAITGLSVFAVAVTADSALNLLHARQYEQVFGNYGEHVMVQLQQERRLSVAEKPGSAALTEQRAKTDADEQILRRRIADSGLREDLSPHELGLVDGFLTALNGLPQTRADIDAGRADNAAIVRDYSALIDTLYMAFSPLTDLADPALARSARGLFSISRTRELLAREDAVVTGAVADGKVTTAEQTAVLRVIGARRQMLEEAQAALTSPHRETFKQIFASDTYTTLFSMEESLSNARAGGKLPLDAKIWRSTADALITQTDAAEGAAAGATSDLANEIGIGAFVKTISSGLLGLICAVISLVLSLRTGRSVVRRLERLRVSALEVAHERLPRAIAALRQPGAVVNDPSLTEVPLVAVGTDEVGQVGHAFGAVQRTAVRAAVDEAILRRGISEVFLNIARRSQALLHRQLTLLDRMERRTTEPQELEDLFRLDHMATRMRRHAEALVILAGAAPGRGWRHPVPTIDVVRGATSEIEDYQRVTVDRMPDVAIVGRAVGDLIHLIAELLENATSFAPPHTRVRVFAEVVGAGLALHVEDRGLGMSDAELLEANAKLAEPPAFDPAQSSRLGLLVVARLAARQGITVRLRPSSYGGITAVVLVPAELVLNDGTVRTEPVLTAPRVPAVAAAPAVAAPVEEQTIDLGTTSKTDEEAALLLPKRVRRSTAPEPATAGSPGAVGDDTTLSIATDPAPPRARSADQVRTMMSAFQSGTVRGRAKAVTEISDNGEDTVSHSRPQDSAGLEDSPTLEGRA